MITSPNEERHAEVAERVRRTREHVIAAHPAKTSAKVPNTSAPSRRAERAPRYPARGERDGSRDDRTQAVEGAVGEAEVREATALLALEEPCVGEQLEDDEKEPVGLFCGRGAR